MPVDHVQGVRLFTSCHLPVWMSTCLEDIKLTWKQLNIHIQDSPWPLDQTVPERGENRGRVGCRCRSYRHWTGLLRSCHPCASVPRHRYLQLYLYSAVTLGQQQRLLWPLIIKYSSYSLTARQNSLKHLLFFLLLSVLTKAVKSWLFCPIWSHVWQVNSS